MRYAQDLYSELVDDIEDKLGEMEENVSDQMIRMESLL